MKTGQKAEAAKMSFQYFFHNFFKLMASIISHPEANPLLVEIGGFLGTLSFTKYLSFPVNSG